MKRGATRAADVNVRVSLSTGFLSFLKLRPPGEGAPHPLLSHPGWRQVIPVSATSNLSTHHYGKSLICKSIEYVK